MERKNLPLIGMILFVLFIAVGEFMGKMTFTAMGCSFFLLANIEANHLELLKKLNDRK